MASTLPEVADSYAAIAPANFKGKLSGKVALITGCSSGIGPAIAKAFAAAGASVAVVARRAEALEKLVSEITSSGGKAIALASDVSIKGAPQKLLSQVESAFGPVDILINNAGISRIGPLIGENEDIDLWWKVHEVNVRAPVAMIRAVLPSMIARGKGGIVMSTSSSVATMDLPAMSAYSSSKAAISKFHEGLVPELEGTGIVSFAVHPGVIKTELGAAADAINKEQMGHPATKKFMDMVTSGGFKGQTAEVCADTMVALCAMPEASVLTGRHINAPQELPPVIAEAQKEGKGRLGKERLYLINVGTL